MAVCFKHLLILAGLYLISNYFILNNNNVCKTFTDYYFPEGNENCYHNPDLTLETPELIKKYAGTVEIHEVTSEDGYIVTMFRIPRKNPKGVILLHHSIATYSHIYLWQGNESLAMRLWHNGFDVWLANQRGTSYSDKHVHLTNQDYRYWNFSFHEMGLYDVSSELELIREKTNESKVIFFGHSLGATIGLVYASLKPLEATHYLKTLILLTPAHNFEHLSGINVFLPNITNFLMIFMDFFEIGSPLLWLSFLTPVAKAITRLFPTTIFFIVLVVWIICGYTPNETDPTFFNYDGIIYTNNFSWKTWVHATQLAVFQRFDYGAAKNLKIYSNETPPLYPIESIAVPTLLISSWQDALIPLKDNEALFKKLSRNVTIHGHWKISELNHLDYHIGLHRKEIFTDKLFAFLNNL